MINNEDTLPNRLVRRLSSQNDDDNSRLSSAPSSSAYNLRSRKPVSTGPVQAHSTSGHTHTQSGSTTSKSARKTLVTRPQPPLWAACTLLLVNAMSLVGIARLGPYLGNPKRPQDAFPYVTAAIPFFFLQMAVEYTLIKVTGFAKHSPAARYDFAGSWSSVTAGAMQQLFSKLFMTPMMRGGLFIYIHEHTKSMSPFRPEMDSTLHFVLLFVMIDFSYYWYHRFAHTNALLWLGHSVHHDAEQYNLSTAMRQGVLQVAVSWSFDLWLALFFPPRAYLTYAQVNTLYQFWVHTCVIRRVGPIEHVFMTPSHHRVHHDRRVHKNFGGILVIWDKLFGSFLDESEGYSAESLALAKQKDATTTVVVEEQCFFGQKRRPTSWGWAVLQLDESTTLARRVHLSWTKHGVVGAVKTLIKGPGYYTAGMRRRNTLPETSSMARFRIQSFPKGSDDLSLWHLYIHTAVAYISILAILLDGTSSQRELMRNALIPVVSLVCQGYLLDSGARGVLLECFRCCMMGSLAMVVAATTQLDIFTSRCLTVFATVHLCSTIMMIVLPHRFERRCIHTK